MTYNPPGNTWSYLCVYLFRSTGSAYYDNVRPLAYPDSDAVLICFDISRPETLDSVLKKVSITLTEVRMCPVKLFLKDIWDSFEVRSVSHQDRTEQP